MRTINRLVIHCAATKASQDIGRDEIDRWHRQRGFSQIGYHYVIRRNGDIEMGRPPAMAGAHAKGYNHDSIGICLVGGWGGVNNFTPIQFENLLLLIYGLTDTYNLDPLDRHQVLGHRDLPDVAKACPSFDLWGWLELADGMEL